MTVIFLLAMWSRRWRESGQTLVEYGMIVTLLAIAAVVILSLVGGERGRSVYQRLQRLSGRCKAVTRPALESGTPGTGFELQYPGINRKGDSRDEQTA